MSAERSVSKKPKTQTLWLLENPEDVHHAFMRRMVKAVSTMCDDEGDIWKIVLKFQEGPDVHLMAHGIHTEGFIDVYEERGMTTEHKPTSERAVSSNPNVEIEAGDLVLVSCADGTERRKVAASGVVDGADFPVVWVMDIGDDMSLPWPCEDVRLEHKAPEFLR